jgi:hypothetical protein
MRAASRFAKAARYSSVSTRAAGRCSKSSSGDCHQSSEWEANKNEQGSSNKVVDDVLATFSPEVRDLALAARTFVLETIPSLAEMVGVKARIIGYGYRPRYVDQFCMLMPTKVGVNLGIA